MFLCLKILFSFWEGSFTISIHLVILVSCFRSFVKPLPSYLNICTCLFLISSFGRSYHGLSSLLTTILSAFLQLILSSFSPLYFTNLFRCSCSLHSCWADMNNILSMCLASLRFWSAVINTRIISCSVIFAKRKHLNIFGEKIRSLLSTLSVLCIYSFCVRIHARRYGGVMGSRSDWEIGSPVRVLSLSPLAKGKIQVRFITIALVCSRPTRRKALNSKHPDECWVLSGYLAQYTPLLLLLH